MTHPDANDTCMKFFSRWAVDFVVTGISGESPHLLKLPGDVKSADAAVHQDTHRLLDEVIDHRQTLGPPPTGPNTAGRGELSVDPQLATRQRNLGSWCCSTELLGRGRSKVWSFRLEDRSGKLSHINS